MATLMESRPFPAGPRTAEAAARKAVRPSKTKTLKGTNTDHRKEQNRVASRNYREKRKQKLALLQQILHEPPSSEEPSAPSMAAPAQRTPAPAQDILAETATATPDPFSFWPADGSTPSPGDGGAPWILPFSESYLPASLPSAAGMTPTHVSTPSSSSQSTTAAAAAAAAAAATFTAADPLFVPAAPVASDVFSDLLMPVDDSLPSPISFLAASQPLDQPLDQPLPFTAELPTRPSPQTIFASLATPSASAAWTSHPLTGGSSNRSMPVLPPPAREARKKSQPVVRAMLQYVETLTPHQKRLILRALLQDGNGGGDALDTENDDGERFEEVGNEAKSVGGIHLGAASSGSSNSSDAAAAATNTANNTTALLSWRLERRRQFRARWISGSQQPGTTDFSAFDFGEHSAAAGSSSSSFGAFSAAAARPLFLSPLMTVTIQCRRMGMRAVLLQNCRACGLPDPDTFLAGGSVDDEYFDPASAACAATAAAAADDEMQSHFALAADEARAVVRQGPARIAAAVAAVRQALVRRGALPPPDLQPVDAQVLVAHHPYIDIIPFANFRARILAVLADMEAAHEVAAVVAAQVGLSLPGPQARSVSSMSSSSSSTPPAASPAFVPSLLDEDDLCYDMTVADGLVCWGSLTGDGGSGLSAQAQRDSSLSRDMRACVPWDMRSWEPQVWFLKKYWFLVGGWDDDMWRCCRWWHSMRGEDLDYSVFASPGY